MDQIAKIELYHQLFIVSLSACAALGGVSAVIFFAMDIRGVIGYLTGQTARRCIRKIEEENAHTAVRSGKRESETTDALFKERQTTQRLIEPLFLQEDPGAQSDDKSKKEREGFKTEREIIIVHTDEVI